MSTPQITLTVTLLDYSGNAQGSAALPAWVRVALCGYGPFLPGIPGTGSLSKISSWFFDIPYEGMQISIPLWGNDVIEPGGTYYAISVLDTNKNVLQTGTYTFTGTQTIDLADATPVTPPTPTPVSGYFLVTSASGTVTISSLTYTGSIVVDVTLTGDATIDLSGLTKGQIVEFIIRQDGTGGWTAGFSANVKNPPLVSTDPNSVSTGSFIVDYALNLYPQNGWS